MPKQLTAALICLFYLEIAQDNDRLVLWLSLGTYVSAFLWYGE